MIIGVPKEIKSDENRVSLIPFGAKRLSDLGCDVLIENDAGLASGYSNQDYIDAGAKIINNASDLFSESDMIIKVKEPQSIEFDYIKENQIIFTYFHFAADKELTDKFIESKAIALSYETVQEENGNLPLLVPKKF